MYAGEFTCLFTNLMSFLIMSSEVVDVYSKIL